MDREIKVQELTLKKIARMLDDNLLDKKQFELLEKDPRKGVRKLIKRYLKKEEEKKKEIMRLHKLKKYELAARDAGYTLIAGVDEAGRGPLAGPVVAAAVILPLDIDFIGLNDSKKLTPQNRDILYDHLLKELLDMGVGIVEVEQIDALNIYRATLLAMADAVKALLVPPDFILVDGFPIPDAPCPQKAIPGGDGLSASIAAASIIAKVTRDRIMEKLDVQYPQYGFARHKGYATAEHRKALQAYGPSPVHRRSFYLGDKIVN